MKKIIKQTVLIPDPRRLADDLIALLDLMEQTTGVFDRKRIHMEVMSHARICHSSVMVSEETTLASVMDLGRYNMHLGRELEHELAIGVLKELTIITSEETR